MDKIPKWDIWSRCKDIANIVKKEGEPVVVIFRANGTFQMTMVNPVDDLPADSEERPEEPDVPHTHIGESNDSMGIIAHTEG